MRASQPPCTAPSQELALSALMKFVQLEGAHPLEKPKWEGNYLFPRELFKVRAWLGGPGGPGWGVPEGPAGWPEPRVAL